MSQKEEGRHGSRGQEEILLQVLKKQEQVYIDGEHGPGLGAASIRLSRLSESLPAFPARGRETVRKEGTLPIQLP